MQNEQCAICWGLKLDKKGKLTHNPLDSHDFTPFDYCTKCKQPKFDQQGFLTHPSPYDLIGQEPKFFDHEFSSKIQAKEASRKKRRKIILVVSGTITLVIAPAVNLINFFF